MDVDAGLRDLYGAFNARDLDALLGAEDALLFEPRDDRTHRPPIRVLWSHGSEDSSAVQPHNRRAWVRW